MGQKAICHNSTDNPETQPRRQMNTVAWYEIRIPNIHTVFATLTFASGYSLQLFNGDEMRLKTAALALLITTPVAAESVQFPVTIPQECFELAQREGVPTVIENRMQATKAKLKLAQMKNSDHLVRECRAAVHRAQQAVAAQTGTTVRSQRAQGGAQAAEARSQNNQP